MDYSFKVILVGRVFLLIDYKAFSFNFLTCLNLLGLDTDPELFPGSRSGTLKKAELDPEPE